MRSPLPPHPVQRTSRAAAVLVALALLATACSGSTAPTATAPAATAPEPTVAPAPETAPEPTVAPTAVPTVVSTVSDDQVRAAADAFVAERSSTNAIALVAAIDGNRDERWAPWLLDLLRVNVSLQVSNSISETLQAITSIEAQERIPDMIAYGAWSQARKLDGGEGYVEFKAALYERIDPDFGPLLRSVDNQLEVAAIQWGGVPLGGIPELNDPPRVPAAEADWMVDDEIVLGVVANGQAVAYPLRILARHELANDTIAGDRLAVVYCTLCRSALIFERDVNGQTLDFLTSGLLLNSNKIMYDPQTGTLWHHLRGIGIGGELLGTELTLRSVNHQRWRDWVAENPNTEVLELPKPIFFDDPERPPISYDYTPGQAYQSYYDSPNVWFPVLDTPDSFSLKTEVVGISRNGDSVAFDVGAFNQIGDTQLIEVGGETLTVEPTGAGVRVFDDTGERIITEQSFWFAWFANHPETRALDF